MAEGKADGLSEGMRLGDALRVGEGVFLLFFAKVIRTAPLSGDNDITRKRYRWVHRNSWLLPIIFPVGTREKVFDPQSDRQGNAVL